MRALSGTRVSIFLLLLTFWASSPASSQTLLTTGAGGSYATVIDHDGLQWFHTGKENDHLSFQYKSFLSVRINGEIYTNNDEPPAPSRHFGDGVVTKTGDTLVVTWLMENVALLQLTYPQQTGNGWKIASKFLLTNGSTENLTAGAQYLLDIQINTSDGTQSLSPRSALDKNGHLFDGVIPEHILFPEHDLPNSPTFNVGLVGEAIFHDDLNPIRQPDRVVVGDWTTLERLAYLPAEYQVPVNQIQDMSMLAQWSERTVTPGTTVELGGFYYGSAEHSICLQESSSMVLAPKQLNAALVGDSSFIIPAYVFNFTSAIAKFVIVRVEVNGPLKFPDGNYSYSYGFGGLDVNMSKFIPIKLLIDTSVPSMAASIAVSVAPGELGNQSCTADLLIVGAVSDTSAPVTIAQTRLNGAGCNSRRDTVIVRDDNARIYALDLSRLNYKVTYLSSSTLPAKEVRLEITVIDTMRDAFVEIRAEDANHNKSVYTLGYCTTPDVMAPVIESDFNRSIGEWVITAREDRPWDRMLNRITASDLNNVSVVNFENHRGKTTSSIRVRVLEPDNPVRFCVNATDLANNQTDTCIALEVASVSDFANASAISLPTPGDRTITIRPAPMTEVKLFDLLGHEVRQVLPASEGKIYVGDLAAGIYILRYGTISLQFVIWR